MAGARRLVRAAIRCWNVPVDAEVAALLVSELVTNAVTHDCDPGDRGDRGDRAGPAAGARIGLTMTGGPDCLRVEIHDASLALPVVDGNPVTDAEHGRGLLLVDMLAASWGCYLTETGKAVFFTLKP